MTRRPPARAGFTLIELLVVIAIIGILVALILPAVQKFRNSGTRAKAASEISQLDEACTLFKNKFGFYPPTRFTFPTSGTDPGAAVFKSMFPRWTPSAVAPPAGFPAAISGIQCLVYFLGGPNNTGWAIDAPVAPSAAATSKITFMQFPQNRVTAAGEYVDPWNTPYVYHGSVAGGNYQNVAVNGVFPLNTAPGKWVNPGGVQIISAGENMQYGTGGMWAPNFGSYIYGQAGGDDMANFNGGKILASQGN